MKVMYAAPPPGSYIYYENRRHALLSTIVQGWRPRLPLFGFTNPYYGKWRLSASCLYRGQTKVFTNWGSRSGSTRETWLKAENGSVQRAGFLVCNSDVWCHPQARGKVRHSSAISKWWLEYPTTFRSKGNKLVESLN